VRACVNDVYDDVEDAEEEEGTAPAGDHRRARVPRLSRARKMASRVRSSVVFFLKTRIERLIFWLAPRQQEGLSVRVRDRALRAAAPSRRRSLPVTARVY
jgi:hypothetical protein